MNESLKINLETILLNLHGKNFRKILEVANKTFNVVKEDSDKYKKYIW